MNPKQQYCTRLPTTDCRLAVNNSVRLSDLHAYIERLNATFRQRLTCLARRARALARTPWTVEACCSCLVAFTTSAPGIRTPAYRCLSLEMDDAGCNGRPAIAVGLTEHCWMIHELLLFKVPTRFNRRSVLVARQSLFVPAVCHDHLSCRATAEQLPQPTAHYYLV